MTMETQAQAQTPLLTPETRQRKKTAPFNAYTETPLSIAEAINRNNSDTESDPHDVSYLHLVCIVLTTSIPTILQEALPFLVYFLNSYFLSYQKNNTLLGGVAIGDSLYQIIIFGFGYGFGFGTNLLAAEAYGTGNLNEAGLILHRSLLLNWVIIIPSILIFVFSGQIFVLLKTVPGLIESAQLYLLYLIIPAILFVNNLSLVNYLIAFTQYTYPSILTLIGASTDILLAYILVAKYEMGVLGLAIAIGAFELVRFIGLVVYMVFFFPMKGARFGFRRESFMNLIPQLKFQSVLVLVSLTMCLMMEVNQTFAGWLSEEETAAQGLMYKLYVIFQTIPDTISYVTCSKVSFYLGNGNHRVAKKYINATGVLIFFQAFIIAILWFIFKNPIISWLAGDNKDLIPHLTEILTCILFVSPIQSILYFYAKQLRSFEANKALIISLGGVVLIQLPLSWLFGIKVDLRLTGLWMGVGISCAVMSILCALFLYRLNFKVLSKKIQDKYKDTDLKVSMQPTAAYIAQVKKEEELI